MWLNQLDYDLPGIGESLRIDRYYNSSVQENGIFGFGWKTAYDDSITTSANDLLRLKTGTGRWMYFGGVGSGTYVSASSGVFGQIVTDTSSNYTLTFKDGRQRLYNSSGKLQWLKDRNGNQTTLNYTSGILTSVTDPFSRTLNFTYGSNGMVSEISDSAGTIATYEYFTGTTHLKTVTYPDGSKYKFEYTSATIGGVSKTFLTTVKDALDNVLESHSYDSAGRATTSEIDGGIESYTLDYSNINASSPYTTVTDGLGRVTKYYFDKGKGRNVITKTDGLCGCGGTGTETMSYEYDYQLNVVKKTDALSGETTYTYDNAGNLLSTTDSLGTETFTYNSLGEVLIHTDRMGGGATNTYSSTGNLLTTTDAVPQPTMTPIPITWTNKVGVAESPTGTVTRNTGNNSWNGAGASSVEYIAANGSLKYTVGQTNKDRMIGIGYTDSSQSWLDLDYSFEILPSGTLDMYENGSYVGSAGSYSAGTVLEIQRTGTTLYYKKNGTTQRTVTGVTAGSLYVDTTIYHDGGAFEGVELIVPSTYLSGNVTTFTYTSAGQIASVTDARSKTTAFTWDSSGRMTKITDANSKETSFGYNARAKVTSVTNALSQTTTFDYDAKDRIETIAYPDSNEVNFDYDLAGRKTSVTDELGHATTYAYDDAYRLTSITDALSHSTSFGYDAMSNLTSQTDALGNVTTLEYNDFNRVKKVVYPAPSPSATPLQETMTYDKNGNVKTKVDTGGRTTSYDYDAANRLTKITDALSNQTQFTYNANSNMTKVKDALNQEYTFAYDAHGNVTSQTRNSQTMSFGYDAVYNRTSRTDYNGNVTGYTYDNLNRLTAVAYTGASGENASYTYDDLSRLLTAVNAAGTVTFTYDNRGRLKTEEDVFGHDLEYSYDAAGRKTLLKLDASNHTAYAYDNANRLTTLTDEASNDFTFAYDNANRLTSRVMPNGVTSTYTYDGMSRLKRLKDSKGGTDLFDRQYSYNSANQISQIADLVNTRNFTYDNIDRLTAVTVGGSTVESYTYDAVGNRTAGHLSGSYTTGSFNRLTATSSASYSYNANGSMTGKTVGSTNWSYGWDRENKMVSASDGTSSAGYVYDALGRRVKRTQGSNVEKFTNDGQDVVLDDINSTITKYQNGAGIDEKLKQVTGGTSKYFLTDHLGSTDAFTNSSGSVTELNSYDSFGNAANGSFSSRYQYTGRELDPLSGINYYRARFYDQNLGRFISEDPMGFRGGDINVNTYVGNHPLMFRDPSGMTAWTNFWFVVNFVFGLGSPARTYPLGSLEQREMSDSPGVQKMREAFYQNGCRLTKFSYSTPEAAGDTLADPRYWGDTSLQVGGFEGEARRKSNGMFEIRIWNVAGAQSFFYHLAPNVSDDSVLFRSIYQDFHWNEQIETCRCRN